MPINLNVNSILLNLNVTPNVTQETARATLSHIIRDRSVTLCHVKEVASVTNMSHYSLQYNENHTTVRCAEPRQDLCNFIIQRLFSFFK